MMIAHPPCTYLSFAGNGSWDQPGRISKRLEALEFFRKLWEAPIKKICLENPKGIASTVITKHHQIIQPYFFGDSAIKTTCLWLKNLPLLKYHNDGSLFNKQTSVKKPDPIYIDNNGTKRHFTEACKGGADRAKNRAKFWPSVAYAMAEQWGDLSND